MRSPIKKKPAVMLEGLGAAPSTMLFDLRAMGFSYPSDVRRVEISFTKE